MTNLSKFKVKNSGIIIIPARKNSKRIKYKNMMKLAGKPLIEHTILHALKSKLINEIFVSTDCKKIAEFSNNIGVNVVQRPKLISGDKSSTEETLLHVLEYRQKKGFDEPEFVVLLQCTSPIRDEFDIDNAIKKFKKNSYDSLLSVCENKNFLWKKDKNNFKPVNYDFNNRKMEQDFKNQYCENGSVYITKTSILKKNHCRLGGKIGFYEMSYLSSFQVDTYDDVKIIQSLIQSDKKINREIKLIIFDFDGVMTDNTALVDSEGKEYVKVSREDGLSLNLLKKKGFEILVLSSEKNKVVKARCKKLNLEYFNGVGKKINCLKQILKQKKISPLNVIYVGNDLNDLECMNYVGFAIAVNDADERIIKASDLKLKKKGGEGVVKEIYNLLNL